MPPIKTKTADQVQKERRDTFAAALSALWSEQCQLPPNRHAELGIVCEEFLFKFFISWIDDAGRLRRQETRLTLHEATENPHFNFTTVFRTLTRGAGL